MYIQTMDDILLHMKSILDERLKRFMEHTSHKLGVDTKDLMECWNESATQKKAKKSHYQIFFSVKRLELKKEDPTLNFGDLSKQISKVWNSMSKEEQNDWVHQHSKPKSDYALLKMSELKSLCEERGLKKTGNKTELINILTGKETKSAIVKTQTKVSENVFEEGIHISEHGGEQRVTIEEADDSQEEDEFVFEEEEDDNQSSLSTDADDYDDI